MAKIKMSFLDNILIGFVAIIMALMFGGLSDMANTNCNKGLVKATEVLAFSLLIIGAGLEVIFIIRFIIWIMS